MSMSTSVIGFVDDKDETYQKYKKVLLACLEADIDMPKEVAEYFGQTVPDKSLLEDKLECEIPFREWRGEGEEVCEIIVSEIPEGVYKIRFVNSY